MPSSPTRRTLLQCIAAAGAGSAGTAGIAGAVETSGRELPAAAAEPVPGVAGDFLVTPLVPLSAPTAVTFGPGDGGPDLYAATLEGRVVRVHLEWTDQGPVPGETTTAADGFGQPLGVAFPEAGSLEGDLLVSDSHANEETGRTDGTVVVVDGDGQRPLLDGLPNGRHNTNHLAHGPDGRLYVTNGNATDDGCQGGSPEVFPYSGAILAVDPADVAAEPAVLEWVDGDGDLIPPEDVADHPVNEDFAATVDVVAHGFRNVYGVAFDDDGVAHTGMNGSDDPGSPDVFYRLDEPEGTDYGYPYCFNDGVAGATGDDVTLEPNPVSQDPPADCHVFDGSGVTCDYPTADALMGWHVCATGLDFPSDGPFAFPEPFRDDAFVGECGPFFPEEPLQKTIENPSTRNTGHKITRVSVEDGAVTGVGDFLTGLGLPTDVVFGPQGAMYVADVEMVYRVQPATV